MRTGGYDRLDYMGNIVTTGRSSTYHKMIIEGLEQVKKDIFHINDSIAINGNGTPEYKDPIVESYLPKHHKDSETRYCIHNVIEYDEDKYPDGITMAQLLMKKLENYDSPIIFVGDTGSGKTHTLRYLWHKYIAPMECKCKEKCEASNKRNRIVIDVYNGSYRNGIELYVAISMKILTKIENMLRQSEYISYWKEFYKFAISENRTINSDAYAYAQAYLRDIRAIPLNDILLSARDSYSNNKSLLIYIMIFYKWILKKQGRCSKLCDHVIIDNIDGAPYDVIVTITELVTASNVPLPIICACRPETLDQMRGVHAVVRDLISHLGPNGYEVVLYRINKYLNKTHDMDALERKLKVGSVQIVPAREFLDNLQYIKESMEKGEIRNMYERLFFWKIRDALVFSLGIVDIAANWKYVKSVWNPMPQGGNTMKEYISGHSNQALIRMLYRPWGYYGQSRIPNIYGTARNGFSKTIGIRILNYIKMEDDVVAVSNCTNEMRKFGYTNQSIKRSYDKMLKDRMITTDEKEIYKFAGNIDNDKENIKITYTGYGIINEYNKLEYIRATMYDTKVIANNYTKYRDRHGVSNEVKLVREYIKEICEYDIKEIEKYGIEEYIYSYGCTTITNMLYCEIISSITKIVRNVEGTSKQNLKEDILDIWSDILKYDKRMTEKGFESSQEKMMELQIEIRCVVDMPR